MAFLMTEAISPPRYRRARPVFLGLLDRRIHEDGAAAPEIDRVLGVIGLSREIRNRIAEGRAKVCKKEPQPEEQASLRMIESIAWFLILKHLISCPPISMTKSTFGGEIFGGFVVGDGLHEAIIDEERRSG
jgi:hypothetical protein